jgi:hypothetical protein
MGVIQSRTKPANAFVTALTNANGHRFTEKQMTSYLLAQVQLKYGAANVARYQAAMGTVRKFFESQNVMLVAGTITRVGPQYEAFNLWQTEDQGHHQRALASISPDDPEARAALTELAATVEHEQLRFLESLPFGDANRHP